MSVKFKCGHQCHSSNTTLFKGQRVCRACFLAAEREARALERAQYQQQETE